MEHDILTIDNIPAKSFPPKNLRENWEEMFVHDNAMCDWVGRIYLPDAKDRIKIGPYRNRIEGN